MDIFVSKNNNECCSRDGRIMDNQFTKEEMHDMCVHLDKSFYYHNNKNIK